MSYEDYHLSEMISRFIHQCLNLLLERECFAAIAKY